MQRKIHAGANAVQVAGHIFINIDNSFLRDSQQCTFVQFTNAFLSATAYYSAPCVHDVNVAIDDFHGSVHDILSKSGIEMIGRHAALRVC